MGQEEKNWNLLPGCQGETAGRDVIFASDGAASVGQIANCFATHLMNRNIGTIIYCATSIGASSETHINNENHARRTTVINGCVSKIFEKLGIKIDFEFVIQDLSVKRIPTLDIDGDEARGIAVGIAEKVGCGRSTGFKQ